MAKKVQKFDGSDPEVVLDSENSKKSLISRDSINDKITEISLDNTVEEVLKWNEDGVRLRFDYKRFLLLPEDAERALYKENAQDYGFAKGLWKEIERQKKEGSRKDPDDPRIEVLGGSASGRMAIRNKDPNMHYSPQRAEDVYGLLSQGYQVCDSSDPASFGDGAAGGVKCTHKRDGSKELVLLKIPKERYQRHLKAVGEESRARVRAPRDSFKVEGKKQGIKTSDDTRHHHNQEEG
jgi:hypothetical protein